MSVELKNWKELCKEKDERIKELEGKFDLIVERLEEVSFLTEVYYASEECDRNTEECVLLTEAIEIVKGVINERD